MDGGADENILLEGGAKFITDKDMVLDKVVDFADTLALCFCLCHMCGLRFL